MTPVSRGTPGVWDGFWKEGAVVSPILLIQAPRCPEAWLRQEERGDVGTGMGERLREEQLVRF